MSLDGLPTELYSAILSHVPSDALQQTVLSLTRALPHSPIPQHQLFHSVRILYPDQAVRLDRRLRSGRQQHNENSPGSTFDATSLVRKFSVETWQVDADVLINLIRMLPNLESLILWIGPSNFAPEHLEELFLRYMPNLRYLSLRFRPYLQKANYYQFHKGAYFDSTLLALSAWPPSPQGLPILSIVQDPFKPDPNPSMAVQRFAQPIVFFRLDLHMSLLIHSRFASASLKSLRLRIPARPIVHPLTTMYRSPNPNTPVQVALPPPIEFLDISTCSVPESDIETLLVRFPHLKHLVLDECTNLLRGGSPPATGLELEWWFALGRRCALAGVKKAREREKELKAWLEARLQSHGPGDGQDDGHEGLAQPRRPRRGRKGLATATISLRTSNSPPRPIPSTSSTASALRHHGPIPKVYIVPPLSSLRSLCLHPTSMTSTPVAMSPETRVLVLVEFEKGWNDGIRVIWEKRGRFGTSFTRAPTEGLKPRFLRFGSGVDVVRDAGREGFEGLEDVRSVDEGTFFRPPDGEGTAGGIPVLCLAGSSRESEGHVEGCGHSVAWDTWEDRM